MAELVQFGKHVISRQNVFLRSKLSFAFVNRKPVLPGRILRNTATVYSSCKHYMLLVCVFPDWVSADVLVATHRVVARFGELTSDEVADLFQCAHRIAPVLQSAFNATALTLALQVHTHTIPTVRLITPHWKVL